MSSDKQINADAFAALQARFSLQSQRAQSYYTVMHEARRIAGSDVAASSWMEQPLAALGGMSPAQLVGEGREAEVLSYVRSL